MQRGRVRDGWCVVVHSGVQRANTVLQKRTLVFHRLNSGRAAKLYRSTEGDPSPQLLCNDI